MNGRVNLLQSLHVSTFPNVVSESGFSTFCDVVKESGNGDLDFLPEEVSLSFQLPSFLNLPTKVR